jgi:hypothetical protein
MAYRFFSTAALMGAPWAVADPNALAAATAWQLGASFVDSAGIRRKQSE